ncbi:MAG: hypothetical protein IKE69_01530 [Thermoguttaceae bacterium]|nr:hypothetical protein [Thermoguttaceae bacterium]
MTAEKKESLPALVERAEGLRQWLRRNAGKNEAYKVERSDVILPSQYWPEGPVRDMYRLLAVAKSRVETAMQRNVRVTAEDEASLNEVCRRVDEWRKISESEAVRGESK